MNKSIKVIESLFVGFCGLYIFFAPFWLFPINIYYLLPLSVFVALSLGFFYNWIWLFQKEGWNCDDVNFSTLAKYLLPACKKSKK